MTRSRLRGPSPNELSVWVSHGVDHRSSGQDQDVVFPWRRLDAVGITHPEPPLGYFGDPLPVPLDHVLVVHDVALDVQVRTAVDLDRPPLAERRDHGFLDKRHPVPAWVLDLHAVLDPEHPLLDLAQFTAVHVFEQEGLANSQCLAVELERTLSPVVLDNEVIADRKHALAHLIARGLRITCPFFTAFRAALLPPFPAKHGPLPAVRARAPCTGGLPCLAWVRPGRSASPKPGEQPGDLRRAGALNL